ncbi:MurR/RpiR family transcriptional regulator [Nakamurella endophytica]|uniref:RpiR family transcriptional regulator n=1 Tax=Nakamurella endophytica TaxID=1748367 RepID=A0A917WBC4_9ACTN|nr:MurR/RpiR family transcriptional regulator [Nakamurella endophytica]GGL86701.1 RpiR family transcriptional regulator [Nakamurella endophytica]
MSTGVADGEVLFTLRGLAPTLVPSTRRVADRILADPAVAAGLTISELAQACGTSETTVVRLCRQLGVRGYRELRVALAAESGRERALADGRGIGGDIGPADDLASVVHSVTAADQRAIADTARTLDLAALAEAVRMVGTARRVDVVGVGASAVVALDLQQKLHRIGLVAFTWSDMHAALTAAALLGPEDVMIGVSHSGATVDTVEALAEASSRGARTVGLTSVPRSPLAGVVDTVLVTAARETTFRSGATSSRIAALSVVDVLFVAVAQGRFDESVRALDATRRAVAPRRVPGAAQPDELRSRP